MATTNKRAPEGDALVPAVMVCKVVKLSQAKTTSERVAAMRAAREVLGLKRQEIYAHRDDWPAIKALSEKLAQARKANGYKTASLGLSV